MARSQANQWSQCAAKLGSSPSTSSDNLRVRGVFEVFNSADAGMVGSPLYGFPPSQLPLVPMHQFREDSEGF